MTFMLSARVTLPGLALALVVGCGSGLSGGDVGSVGAVFGRDNETRALVVREAPPGAGAEKAGLLPGDQVVMIDGWYVRGMNAKDIRARLRGEIGTSVRLTVVRGSEVHHLRVQRGELAARRAAPPREERIAE
jgi:C-terminal processing protease CtpA/Prc